MIKYLEHHFIDLTKYDTCVKLDRHSLPYGESWYLNTVCEKWDCLVLNDYDAVWPLPVRRKMGLKYFYRPFGIQQLGIFSKSQLSQEQETAFLSQLSRQTSYADLYGNEGQWAETDLPKGFRTDQLPNYVLPINRPYQEIFEGYNTNLKRKLKKVRQGQNLQLFEHDGPEVLIDLFRAERQKALKLPEAFYHNMKRVMFRALHSNQAKIYTVYGGPNQLLAGACFLETQGRSVFLFSALSALGKEYQAMPYLINEYIIFQSEKKGLLDFEGSRNPGLGRFYRSFGAEERPYYRLRYLNGPAWLQPLMK